MIAVSIFDYLMALAISRCGINSSQKKWLLGLTLAGNIGVLFIFKYLNFTLVYIDSLGFNLPLTQIRLPIGISFFTFQAMSYVIDVYRNTVPAQKNPWYIGLYISFFPQLIAGPIVRYQTIASQLDYRVETIDDFAFGVHRFLTGFGKKILLANNMALIADKAFALPDPERSVIFAWLGALAYAFQIFFDFSGYSDMAIGLGHMFGFKFLENFNYPYISQSISEFWRRWHISLGQWFRDYLYFPLGGSRVKTKLRLICNLFIVWSVTGLWHGASWNFILWGIMYFVLITFEKLTGWPGKLKLPVIRIIYQIVTLVCVLGSWVLFRALNISFAKSYLLSMIGQTGNPVFCANTIAAFRDYKIFFLASLLCSTPLSKLLKERVVSCSQAVRVTTNILSFLFYFFILVWSFSYIVMGAHNPFIYFNF
jgi:alginate O-acetyltransferase complex protein AlgI